MQIQHEISTNFKKYEYDTNYKVLLNICNTIDYNVTDSNVFYSRFYNKIENEFKESNYKHKFGDINFCNIFTYHIVCNMFCVEWPKSYYNMIPFKLNYFEKCCLKLNNFIIKNNIKKILSPIFGSEILQGNWKDIINTMNDIFSKDITYIIFRYNGNK